VAAGGGVELVFALDESVVEQDPEDARVLDLFTGCVEAAGHETRCEPPCPSRLA